MQSRRSNPNLSYLTLAPLSSRLPLDDEEGDDVQVPTPWAQRTSYISGKSAPTTPGILSRTPSHARLGASTSNKLAGSRSYTQLAFTDGSALSKSKSTTLLVQPQGRRKKKTKSTSHLHDAMDSGEWLYRAGAAITSETRESKGQSWLVSRESSTSLVAQNQPDGFMMQTSDTSAIDSSFGAASARASRNHSRAPSARTSRRGSKVGSKADLTYFATPTGPRSALTREALDVNDYFGQLHDSSAISGPDFVDAEEEDDDDGDSDDEEDVKMQEDEVAKLASDRGFGLGGVIDRLIGWTLFEVKEEGHETEDDEANDGNQIESQAPKREQTRATQQSHIKHQQSSGSNQSGALEDQEARGGWADAAWLLSVASKVVL